MATSTRLKIFFMSGSLSTGRSAHWRDLPLHCNAPVGAMVPCSNLQDHARLLDDAIARGGILLEEFCHYLRGESYSRENCAVIAERTGVSTVGRSRCTAHTARSN